MAGLKILQEFCQISHWALLDLPPSIHPIPMKSLTATTLLGPCLTSKGKLPLSLLTYAPLLMGLVEPLAHNAVLFRPHPGDSELGSIPLLPTPLDHSTALLLAYLHHFSGGKLLRFHTPAQQWALSILAVISVQLHRHQINEGESRFFVWEYLGLDMALMEVISDEEEGDN
ncbi:hypothetical protein K439DRAFT_1625163 [Ramaria rubella]|nr:hypothetical protein K439DRAFT_1625163 [Ramaria rubella]